MLITTEASEAWRIGMLFSSSGVTSAIEHSQLNGALLAVHEINEAGGVAGRELKPIIYDPQSVPSRYGMLAERMLSEDGVTVIFGCYMSSSRKAVIPVVERRNALLFYPTLYEGFEYSPNVFYGGAAPNQNSVPLARYLMEHYGNSFYFIGSDYVYPRESNRVMRHIVRQAHGDIIEEKYLSLNADLRAYERVAKDISAKKPDVIFSTVVGDGTVKLYRAYREFSVMTGTVPIGSLTTSEAEVALMGNDVARGHITASPYFNTLESTASTLFKSRYYKLFGADCVPITGCCEAAYVQVHMFGEALKMAGRMDTETLRYELAGAEYNAPQGLVKIDPDNNHTFLYARIGKVSDHGEFSIEYTTHRSIKPDPYLVYPGLDDWTMRSYDDAANGSVR